MSKTAFSQQIKTIIFSVCISLDITMNGTYPFGLEIKNRKLNKLNILIIMTYKKYGKIGWK